MRKFLALLLVLCLAVFSSNVVYAQDANGGDATEQVDDAAGGQSA